MVASHLLAHCQEALCVAEDTAVAFYGAKTLRKFRVERFNGARICGLYIQTVDHVQLSALTNNNNYNVTGNNVDDTLSQGINRNKNTFKGALTTSISTKSKVLHVIDDEGNWFVVELNKLSIIASSTIALSKQKDHFSYIAANGDNAIASKTVGIMQKVKKPIIAARPSLEYVDPTRIIEAHFYELHHVLYCVLLTNHNVQYVRLHITDVNSSNSSSNSNTQGAILLNAKVCYEFTRPLQECTLAVSEHTGIIVLAQRGAKWMRVFRIHHNGNDNDGIGIHIENDNNIIHATTTTTNATTSITNTVSRSSNSVEVDVGEERVLPIVIQSIACNPVNESIAIGGVRGELYYFPVAHDTHHFSDHWHHTPLTALCFASDGASLFTGAAESIVLMWNLTSYTHKKISCNVGSIQCITPSCSFPATLLLACGVATLGIVDVLSMRLEHHVEGVEWSCGATCTGLLVEEWMGQSAVILTGLPHVLRVCDPLTQQSMYSLHISAQMEVLPQKRSELNVINNCNSNFNHELLPEERSSITKRNNETSRQGLCGISFAGMLRGGRVIVTYECFNSVTSVNNSATVNNTTTLPSLLRFWEYHARTHHHMEVQTIYTPHSREVIALEVDKAHGRVFTLSQDEIKCWEEVAEERVNVLAAPSGHSWRNQSTQLTPTQQSSLMCLSHDGSLCCVADDCVYVYSVESCSPGVRWPLIRTLVQSLHTHTFSGLAMMSECKVIVAYDATHVYFWELLSQNTSCTATYTSANVKAVTSVNAAEDRHNANVTFTALCPYTSSSVLVAQSNLTLVELSCATSRDKRSSYTNEHEHQLGTATAMTTLPRHRYTRIEHMVCVNSHYARLAIIDTLRGFRLIELSLRSVEHSTNRSNDTLPLATDVTDIALTEDRNTSDTRTDKYDADRTTQSKTIQEYFNTATNSNYDGYENVNDDSDNANISAFNKTSDYYLPTSLQTTNYSMKNDHNDSDGNSEELLTNDERLHFTSRVSAANLWLEQMLHEPAYTAPPISSMLSSYLHRQSNGNYSEEV